MGQPPWAVLEETRPSLGAMWPRARAEREGRPWWPVSWGWYGLTTAYVPGPELTVCG